MVSTPKAPDPYATAAAQTASNQQTANYQQGLNMVNQVTPYGSLTYSGTNNGQPGAATVTTTLSPDQQKILNQNTQSSIKMGDIANQQLDKVGGILNTPFDPNFSYNPGQVSLNGNANQQGVSLKNSYDTSSMNDAINNKITDIGRQRLDPQWQQNQENFEQDMMNRGIRPGSQAYNMARSQFDQSRNDAYNGLYTSAFGAASQAAQADNATNASKAGFYNDAALQGGQFNNQAALTNTDYANQQQLNQTQANNAANLNAAQFNSQAAYAQRNQPLNEISALMSGSQVTNPTFGTTPQSQVAGTDIAGLINSNYQAKLSNYQSTMGGLFGLGSAALGAAGNVFKPKL